MSKLSIVIPSRNEEYLNHTVKNILERAKGEIEVIVVLDGDPFEPVIRDERVTIIYRKEPKGMRDSINTGARIATGEYLLKCDAHCAFDHGFDVKLIKDLQPDWTVVPRRFAIDKKNWTRHPNKKLHYDFQYIGHPSKENAYAFKGVDWPEYGARVKGKEIVPLMTSQGSCWIMYKKRFEELGGLDEENYGSMGAEAQETCLKSWLSGGSYMLNRNTWYAHKKKRVGKKKNDRGYRKPRSDWKKSRKYCIECWTNNLWPGQTRSLAWLIKKFKPVPGWHTDMRTVHANRYIREKFKLNYAEENYPRLIKGLDRIGLVELWKELGYKVGCEVGVEKGRFSAYMFKQIPDLKMYLVDPYDSYIDVSRQVGPRPWMRKIARNRMKGFNAQWVEEYSETAFNKVPDDSLDFVYIDGNHRYDYVMLDIILWIRKVRKGGMIAGHDYTTWGRHYAGRNVQKAVDDYIKAHKIMPTYFTDDRKTRRLGSKHASWFWIRGSR